MKNTVKLEQFVALKEKDLQKIKGGEMRLSKFFRDFILQRKSNEIRGKSNGFIWI
ncbi:COMC family protein [Streptococcus pneumoniae GA13723]|nr:COMC family protein [Streptococcus pneumoniae GA13723]